MTRFRLRFLLQEIDLPQGTTVLGRSAACQVTLDDPLVSREHALVCIEGEQATLKDLRSRNGVRVAGHKVADEVPLKNGDRIGIGTQELVFVEVQAPVEAARRATRQTGYVSHCAACGRAYPVEVPACPACESSERLEPDEDTLTGAGTQGLRDFGLELATEAIIRARTVTSGVEIEALLTHARTGLEHRLAEGRKVERELVDGLAQAAVELAASKADAAWAHWALSIYAALTLVPPAAVCQDLALLPPPERERLAAVAERIFTNCPPGVEERAALATLRGLFGTGS